MDNKKSNLKNFFSPKTVALIGASEVESKVGGILFKKLITSKVKVVPINPHHDELKGIKCYKNILDYSKKIDLAIIAVPSLFVPGALTECGKKGIKEVIIISAGFSEIGNLKGEKEIVEISKKYNINFIGPNCFGVSNLNNNFDTTFSINSGKKGNIAFISQSGALWSYLSDFSNKNKNFGFSNFVSLGNMADLEFSDFIDYFCKDKKTKSIILYIEKLKDGKKFMNICKSCNKKIYAIKSGITEKGSEAAFSHTASLASDYNIYRGAFKQAGVILCDSLIEALEKCSGKKILSEKGSSDVKIGRKVFILTNAGGAGALLADYLSQKSFSVVQKPLDILGTASGSDYFNALEKIKDKTFYDSILVILTPQSMSEIKKTAQVIANFKLQTGKIIVPLFLGGASMNEANEIFEKEDISYFNTLEEARDNFNF